LELFKNLCSEILRSAEFIGHVAIFYPLTFDVLW